MDPNGLTSITSQFDPRIAALLGWVALVAKILVDWIKTALTLPTWAPPLAAYLASLALLLLLLVALGVDLTPQLAAQAAILALVAAVLAVGSTALQARTKPGRGEPDPLVVAKVADELEARREARVMARLRQVAEDGV